MKVTWKFFAGLVSGVLLMLGITAAEFWLNIGVPTASSRWAFEINQLKRASAENVRGPKVLIVGGSATLFGISAREFERQTGCRTINLGTHAALGPTYILHLARDCAKPGDTVVLGFEYELYEFGPVDPSWADKLFLDYLIARDPAYLRTLSLREQWNVFMLTPQQRLIRGLKNRGRPEPPPSDTSLYSVARVDAWGDQLQHTKAERPALRTAALSRRSHLASGLSAHPAAFPVIAEFCRWAAQNRIRVLAMFPNLCDQPEYHEPDSRRSIDQLRRFFAGLQVPVIGDYTDALRPPDDFFDTFYHLTEEAAIDRTQKLADQMRPYLPATSPPK